MHRLKVSELASEVGISSDALRYYERIGLLSPERTASGYRMYDAAAADRVRFIKRAQRFGLRLADIAGLVAIQERGLCPCGGTRQLLESRMAELDEEMAALQRLRQEIGAMLDDDRRAERGDVSECGPLCGGSKGDLDPSGAVTTIVTLLPTHKRPSRYGKVHHHQQTRSIMSITQNVCGCGSATTTDGAGAGPCSCGCCGTEPVAPASTEERVAELRALRDNIDQELAELDRV